MDRDVLLPWPGLFHLIPGEGQGQVPLQLGEMTSLPGTGSRVSFLLLQGPKGGSEALWSVFRNPNEETSPQPHPQKPGHHLDDCASDFGPHPEMWPHHLPRCYSSHPLSDSFLTHIRPTFSPNPSRPSLFLSSPSLLSSPGPVFSCLLLY